VKSREGMPKTRLAAEKPEVIFARTLKALRQENIRCIVIG
jgi:hypothetical protein